MEKNTLSALPNQEDFKNMTWDEILAYQRWQHHEWMQYIEMIKRNSLTAMYALGGMYE